MSYERPDKAQMKPLNIGTWKLDRVFTSKPLCRKFDLYALFDKFEICVAETMVNASKYLNP